MSANLTFAQDVSDVGIDLTEPDPAELARRGEGGQSNPESNEAPLQPATLVDPPRQSSATDDEQTPGAPRRFLLVRLGRRLAARGSSRTSGFLASGLFHGTVMVVLSLIAIWSDRTSDPQAGLVAALLDAPDHKFDALDLSSHATDMIQMPEEAGDVSDEASEANITDTMALDDEPQKSDQPWQPNVGSAAITPSLWAVRAAATRGGGLEGRGKEARARGVKQRGGTPASESAVRRGLDWLRAHQWRDGGWRFDHRNDLCEGRCANPGTLGSTTGATALALLPFLGAGHTHVEGDYQAVVKRGLDYLLSRRVETDHGGDFQEGTMYAHALSTIVLCEAYAMTGDDRLSPAARGALEFIVSAQDPRGGGWRYFPRQAGDTTSFGWQLMALKSGQLAGLGAYSPSIELARKFLDGVQTDDGAFYGYQVPERKATTTSIGLLCRMYTGWPRDHKSLTRGVEYLSRRGPSKANMYYNYYATQVLHHYEGPHWDVWNRKLRDYLVHTQAAEGHERGSWYFRDGHASIAGRLYTTAMAVMTLEVYYRYMPLYGSRIMVDDF